MALGLERAIAEFIGDVVSVQPAMTTDPWPLYDEADPVVFVTEEPVGREDEDDTARDLTISVFTDGGGPPLKLLGEQWTITIQCRHPSYETTMEVQRQIYEALQMNGGQSNGANPLAQGLFNGIRIWRIVADFPPLRLGRDVEGRDGRYKTTQSFTVDTLPFTFS